MHCLQLIFLFANYCNYWCFVSRLHCNCEHCLSLIDKIDDNDCDINRFIVELGGLILFITVVTLGYTVVWDISGDTRSPANKNFFCVKEENW